MKTEDSLLLLGAREIGSILAGREREVMKAVGQAYIDHQAGRSCLPHSVFVRFPGKVKERIIALPGYLGGKEEIAGIKWISSFPNNLAKGMSRASAIMVLNSLENGRPTAVLEASLISAARTAASAAVAADVIHRKGAMAVVGVIGCGLINREVVRFLSSLGRQIGSTVVFDVDKDRAAKFRDDVAPMIGAKTPISIAQSVDDVLRKSDVTTFATTAVEPTVTDISMCRPGATILHVSLRDIVADAILAADNVVDDVDHVLRAQTSVHLAEQKSGSRDFVRCTLAQILTGEHKARRSEQGTTIFSPFGLGVLDLAVGQMVATHAAKHGLGTRIQGFFEGA
jgi:N-[(2S)-2-amino-2-carboxyethyl]-L-glutamate dehydrogenase